MSSTPGSALSSPSSGPTGLAIRCRALAGALALAVGLSTGIVVSAASAAHAAKARVAQVTIGKITVEGAKLTIVGRVTLPPIDASTAKLRKSRTATQRRQTKVDFTLSGAVGKVQKSESFTATLDGRDRFSVAHTTQLSGALGLAAVVKIAGRTSGKRLVKTVSVAAAGKSGAGATSGTTTPSSSAPGSPGSPSTQGTVLQGTFDLETGSDVAATGAVVGSYFQMITTGGGPLTNAFSPLANQNYTPLSPGTAGGLETYQYQPAANPAFDDGATGNALSAEIMQPQNFFGDNFSVVTQPNDPQNGDADPLPQIVDLNGALSGQVSAWAVGWNGQWFNQGTPKPDGTLPSGTTPLQGSYDTANGHYVLEWKSLIVGGPFNGFQGSWHLEGRFVPTG